MHWPLQWLMTNSKVYSLYCIQIISQAFDMIHTRARVFKEGIRNHEMDRQFRFSLIVGGEQIDRRAQMAFLSARK